MPGLLVQVLAHQLGLVPQGLHVGVHPLFELGPGELDQGAVRDGPEGGHIGVQLHDELHAAEGVHLVEAHIVVEGPQHPVVRGLDGAPAHKEDGVCGVAFPDEHIAAFQLLHLEHFHEPERGAAEVGLELLLPSPVDVPEEGQGAV